MKTSIRSISRLPEKFLNQEIELNGSIPLPIQANLNSLTIMLSLASESLAASYALRT